MIPETTQAAPARRAAIPRRSQHGLPLRIAVCCLFMLGLRALAIAAPPVALAHARSSRTPSVIVTLRPASPVRHGAGSRRYAVYQAGGFRPFETVSVSWGARDEGEVAANGLGEVTGRFAVSWGPHHKPQSLGLYGLTSGRALVGIAEARPRRHIRHATPLPPLLFASIPGPAIALDVPLEGGTYRVPVGALAVPPAILLIAMRWRLKRWRKRRRAARGRQVAQ